MLHGPGVYDVVQHSYRSNCEYEMDYEQELITVKTVRFIAAGEGSISITTGDWNNETLVWFDTKP